MLSYILQRKTINLIFISFLLIYQRHTLERETISLSNDMSRIIQLKSPLNDLNSTPQLHYAVRVPCPGREVPRVRFHTVTEFFNEQINFYSHKKSIVSSFESLFINLTQPTNEEHKKFSCGTTRGPNTSSSSSSHAHVSFQVFIPERPGC